jgi:drug/metabolite transporter (DMT)-like permease
MAEIETKPARPGIGLTARADFARELRQRRTGMGFGFLLVTAFCWGLNWPLMKYLLRAVPPFTMRAISGVLGAVVAFGLAALLGESLHVPRGQRRQLVILALLNFTSLMGSATLAMLWLSASEAVIIAYTLPLWAVLIAWPVLGERPGVLRVLALALGLGGVAVLMGAQPVTATWAKLPGVLVSLSGAVLFALGTVLSKGRPLRMPAVAGLAWQIAIGTAPMVVAACFEHPQWVRFTTPIWLLLAYLGVVPLALAYYTWFRALKLLPASTAATASLLVPLIGVIGSAVLLGEPLGARQLVAMAMTLAGIGLAARAR